jgi:transcriptional regulator with XRE-family HTH domain
MKSTAFGSYLKQIREQKNIPQRIVAHRLDIDTSTLSKIELGERQITISMITGLAEVLQIKYITEKIMDEFGNQPFLKEALLETLKNTRE